MRMVVAAAAILLNVALIGAEAEGAPPQKKTRIELPDFESAEKAAEWGKAKLRDAKGRGSDAAANVLLMQAASALKIAQDWKDVSIETKVDAAAAGAEAFLCLNALMSAVALLAGVDIKEVKKSAAAAAFLERGGEAMELRGQPRSALISYAAALEASPGADWKSLLLYRAGMCAVAVGNYERGAAFLEEAATMLPETSLRASVVQLLLGQAYVGLKDGARAEAWLTKASRSLDRRGSGGPVDTTGLPTFVHEPTDSTMRRKIAEAEATVKDLH